MIKNITITIFNFKTQYCNQRGQKINPDCSSAVLPVISQCDSGVCSKPSLILKFSSALALSHLPTVIDLKMLLTTSSLRYSFSIYEHLINKQWSIHTANGNQKTAGNIKRRMLILSYAMDTARETDEIDSTHVTAGANFKI